MAAKFESVLSASTTGIKATRAKLINEEAQEVQEEILRDLKKQKRDLSKKMMNLTDIAPDSELSLRVVRQDFDAATLFKEIQEIKIEMANKDVEIELAQETYDEWFKEKDEKED